MLGWRTRCAVEINPFARSVLLSRQRDGHLDKFPIWDDIETFDGRPWRQTIDVVSGGFPCQDISAAGKGEGLSGERSGLWFEMLRVVEEVRPRFVFAENSPNLRTRGLGTVIEGLGGLGYDVRWCVLGARHVGAPHQRNRIWILACDTNSESKPAGSVNAEVAGVQKLASSNANSEPDMEVKPRRESWEGREDTANFVWDGGERDVASASSTQCEILREPISGEEAYSEPAIHGWWTSEPELGRVADGVANRLDRLRAIGNGQVPRVAAEAFTILSDGWL